MNIDFERLQFLRKDVQEFIDFSSHVLGYEMDEIDGQTCAHADWYGNQNVIEYGNIKIKIEEDILNQYSDKALLIFQTINLRDFDLEKIKEDLESIGQLVWDKRTKDEELRDKLLGINHSFYVKQYLTLESFKKLQKIQGNRHFQKFLIKLDFIKKIKKVYFLDFKAGKFSNLKNTFNLTQFIEDEANQQFQQRNKKIIQRDKYAFITIDDYKQMLMEGFTQAKYRAQKEIRNKIYRRIRYFLERKISLNKNQCYYNNLDNELNSYLIELFDNRKEENIEKENHLLVDINNYKEWSSIILRKIKDIYPEPFRVERDRDYDDYDLYDKRHSSSRYEKYGGYNGFDDDAIDSAFEGDPTNTWNVD